MKRYEILEHKADLKIRVFGKDKKDLFLNALRAMQENMQYRLSPSHKKTKRKISIKSFDLPTLLADFLSEILYYSSVHREIYSNIKFVKFSSTELKAEIAGQKVESFGEDIKAVTYYNLDVRQNKKGQWEAVIVFDI